MKEIEKRIVYLEGLDLYCLMFLDKKTGKYLKADEYEQWMRANQLL
jgi:hypothetical protein